jgi:biotin operon repressor
MTDTLARRAAVLALLEAKAPGWVSGPEIASESVGGSEGLRRLRELRDAGYRIDKQRIPGRDSFRYRLVGAPGGANPENVQPVRSGMRPNSQPGRPDRYVDLSKSDALAMDQMRTLAQEEAKRKALETPYNPRPRVQFGQSICPACKGTGGNLLSGPCPHCGGSAVV